ncbi:MAG: hypothetical protein J6U74_05100, partial [Clostridia bacterium]|nr:hypothetical protein [Clostridia bacterium]
MIELENFKKLPLHNGCDLNDDGTVDEEDIEEYLRDNINYREEFGVDMSVSTTESGVMIIKDAQNNTYYESKQITVKDENNNDV